MGRAILSLFLLTLLIGCADPAQTEAQPTKKEDLIEGNKARVSQEKKRIDSYVKRRDWEMTETGTGLYYMIYDSLQAEGNRAENNDIVTVVYKVLLLDGTLCYETTEGPETLKIGKAQAESGVQEGLTYLRKGDKARLIIPPHLAHGLLGDMNKIPGNTVIMYDIEIVNIQ